MELLCIPELKYWNNPYSALAHHYLILCNGICYYYSSEIIIKNHGKYNKATTLEIFELVQSPNTIYISKKDFYKLQKIYGVARKL